MPTLIIKILEKLDSLRVMGILIRRFQVRNLISHSFGGVATTYALFNNRDLEIDTYILLTTPDKFTERIDDVSEMVGITKNVKERLIFQRSWHPKL